MSDSRIEALFTAARQVEGRCQDARMGWRKWGRVPTVDGRTFAAMEPLHIARNAVLADIWDVTDAVAAATDELRECRERTDLPRAYGTEFRAISRRILWSEIFDAAENYYGPTWSVMTSEEQAHCVNFAWEWYDRYSDGERITVAHAVEAYDDAVIEAADLESELRASFGTKEAYDEYCARRASWRAEER